jgi:hypothetical protein
MTMSIHGGRTQDQQLQVDGMSVTSLMRIDSALYAIVDTPFQEFVYNYSASSAEVETGGVRCNMIPRDG